mgnify:CR=1 FL=1
MICRPCKCVVETQTEPLRNFLSSTAKTTNFLIERTVIKIEGVDITLHDYLFGSISAVTPKDLIIVWVDAIGVLALIVWRWSALLTATLNEDLAHACGINPIREQLILTLALAVIVAVAIKITGILLITAMLIILAATARPFSNTPEKMAFIATLIGACSAFSA